MPPPRKVDLLPSELRGWLQDALRERGFGGYEDLADELNWKLEEAGLELRIGKSALHAFGSEFREYAVAQEQAQGEMKAFLQQVTASDEVDVTSALFQQLTSIAFRTQMAIAREGEGQVDPRGLKDLTQALNNLIRSTELREGIMKSERARIATEARAAAADEVTKASDELGLTSQTVQDIRAKILGQA